MKDFTKTLGILFVGLFTCIFAYPFLHEAGHALATLFSGAELIDICVFPIPYVTCNMVGVSRFSQCLIGLSGMIFPFLVSIVIMGKNIWIGMFSFFLRAISLLAFFLSYLALICFRRGLIWENEDIVKVVEIAEPISGFWIVFSLLMLIVCSVSIYLFHPVRKLRVYYQI